MIKKILSTSIILTMGLGVISSQAITSSNSVTSKSDYKKTNLKIDDSLITYNTNNKLNYINTDYDNLNLDQLNLYKSAFNSIESSDFDAFKSFYSQITNSTLLSYLEFHKLFSPSYNSSYDELITWLETYGDHPLSARVWSLAKRKKPAESQDPPFPELKSQNKLSSFVYTEKMTSQSLSDNSIDDSRPAYSQLHAKSARSAYNNGQIKHALKLSQEIGDTWITGLSAWRLNDYQLALEAFEIVATDESRNAWSRSGGAYWAGRVAEKLDKPQEAKTYYQLAATFPFTFYGLISEQKLGITPAVVRNLNGINEPQEILDRHGLTNKLSFNPDFAKGSPQAQRLKALVSIGQKDYAEFELRMAMQKSASNEERQSWAALGAMYSLNISPIKSNDKTFDRKLYPLPNFKPKNGYKISKSLLFAIARKESKFNPKSKSYAGAYGLMQVMPSTAASIMKDPKILSTPDRLLEADINLDVGQSFIINLLESGIVKGDLLRAIGAYNSGSRPIQETVKSLGDTADSLLIMESVPVAQTRQYIEEVAAAYWIYRHLQGQKSPSLVAAANNALIIRASDDW